jgi:hypothetical protein
MPRMEQTTLTGDARAGAIRRAGLTGASVMDWPAGSKAWLVAGAISAPQARRETKERWS